METKLNDLRLDKLRLQEERCKLRNLQWAHQLRSKQHLFHAYSAKIEKLSQVLICIEREITQLEEALTQKRYSKRPT